MVPISLSLISLAVLILVVRTHGFNLSALSPISLIVALLLLLFSYLMGGLRLKLLSSYAGEKLSLRHGIKAHVLGLFSAAMTPSGSGHMPMMALSLQSQNISSTKAWSISLYSNIVDLLCYAWMLPLCITLLLLDLNTQLDNRLFIAAGLAIPILIILVYLFSFRFAYLEAMAKRLFQLPFLQQWSEPAHQFITKFHESMLLMSQQRLSRHLRLQLISSAMHIASFSILYTLLRGAHMQVPVFSTIAITFLVLLVGFVIPTPGGSGYTEAAATMLLGQQTDFALVLPAVLVWRFLSHYSNLFIGPIIGGTTLLKRIKLEKANLES